MEFLVALAFIGYLFYLWNYAGFRRKSKKEATGTNTGPAQSESSFFDKQLAINMVMVILTSVLLIYIIKEAESIHLPYLVAVFSAISIGFAEPYKGWLLAIMQSLLIVAGYFAFVSLPEDSPRAELEKFSLYGSMVLTFAASFLGAFLKRALSMK